MPVNQSKANKIPNPNYKIPRIIIGVISFVCLASGALLYMLQPSADPFTLGMLVRVGALLGVICLAFPELLALKGRMPAIILGLALISIVIIAVRPEPGRILVSLLVIGVGVSSVAKWVNSAAKNDPRKR